MTGDQIAIEARSWIGTPYLHQASLKGAGADCLGLIRGIWRVCHGPEPVVIPSYTPDWAEPQRDEVLWRSAACWLCEHDLCDERVGDVLLFRMARGAVAKHLGIQVEVGGNARFVHAYSRHGVVESALSHPWRQRVVTRFSFS